MIDENKNTQPEPKLSGSYNKKKRVPWCFKEIHQIHKNSVISYISASLYNDAKRVNFLPKYVNKGVHRVSYLIFLPALILCV